VNRGLTIQRTQEKEIKIATICDVTPCSLVDIVTCRGDLQDEFLLDDWIY
jgi:hypothetical protein